MKAIILTVLLTALLASSGYAQEWVGLWQSGGGIVYGLRADGQVWGLDPTHPDNPPFYLGSFGTGPWVAVSCSFGGVPKYALKSNGEIWAMWGKGGVDLSCSLPSDKEWCALMSGCDVWLAVTCTGEIWTTCAGGDSPHYVGTLPGQPVPTKPATWGAVRSTFR